MNQTPGSIIDQTLNAMLKVPAGLDNGAPPRQSAPVPPSAPAQPNVQQPVRAEPVLPQSLSQAQPVQPSVPPISALMGVQLPNFSDEPPADAPVTDALEGEHVEEVDPDEADLPVEPSAVNFKKLRESRKEERRKLRELEAQHQEVASKLERYEKGEVMPEVLQAKDRRIQELEPYEKAVNLKMSREYQESFVVPAQRLKGELEQLGADYGVPNSLMHQAVEITNRRELNQFLAQHFDDIGALEVKRVVGELQNLGEKAIEAEEKPAEIMSTLRAQYQEKEQKEAEQRVKVFESVSKNAWHEALEMTKNEGEYKELILSDTDPEFNKKYVEPIQQTAAVQYGALVKQLSKNGLKNLPPELAKGLARMVLLSIGGALTISQKNKAQAERNNIANNAKRLNPYLRPSIGGTNGSGHASKARPAMPTTPGQAADAALARMGKR